MLKETNIQGAVQRNYQYLMTNAGVRRTAGWIQQLNDRVFEFLTEEGRSTLDLIAARPKFDASSDTVRESCRALRHVGLTCPFASDCCGLTMRGQLHLTGDLDAAHQPRPRSNVTG